MKITKDAIEALINNKYRNLEQTEAVCLEAVKQNGDAVYYFSDKSEKSFLAE